jgi:hypothetical protein
MSTVSGLGTTFNLPNYHGELIAITPIDTPLLSASGGLSGGLQTTSTTFEWQSEDLRDPDTHERLEGADAPASEERARANVENVVEIFHESVSTSYTKQATSGQYATSQSAPFQSNDGTPNPIADEHGHQVANALKTIARDVNYVFWHGVKAKPTTNANARHTGGLLPIITTNRFAVGEVVSASAATDTITGTHAFSNGDKVVFTSRGASIAVRTDRVYYVVGISTTVSFKVSATLGGAAITVGTATVSVIKAGAAVDVDNVNILLQSIFDNGGISEQGTATIFASSRQKRGLTKAYATAYGNTNLVAGDGRNVGGVSLETIKTDFGTLNIAIDRALPPDALVVVSLEQIAPVFLSIPDKGVLFEEELAKTGASIKSQIYGEIGLKYGNERAHGVIRGLLV